MEKLANHPKTNPAVVASRAMAVILFVAGFAAPFILLHFSIFAGDEQYQTLNAINYKGNAIAPLSSFLTYLWGRTFSFSMVSMRTLAAVLSTITIIVCICYVYKCSKNLWKSVWIAGACMLISSSYQVFSYAIGWDVFSNLFIVCSLVSILIFFDGKSSRVYLITTGIFSAFATAARLPSASSFPIICLLFILNKQFSASKRIKHVIIFTIAYATTLLFTLLIIFGSIGEFISQCSIFLHSGLSDDHSMGLARLYGSTRPFIIEIFRGTSLMLFVYISLFISKKHTSLKWIGRFVAIFFIMYFVISNYKIDIYQFNIPIAYACIFFALIGIAMYNCVITTHDKKQLLCILAITLLAIPSSIMSNAGIAKILSIPLIPIVLLYTHETKIFRSWGWYMSISLVLITFYSKMQYAWFDRGLRFESKELKLPQLKGIYTTPQRVDIYSSVYNSAVKLDECLVVGRGRYLIEYTTNKINYDSRHYFSTSLNNAKYTDFIVSQLKLSPKPVLVIDLDPIVDLFDLQPEYKSDNLMLHKLSEIGYTLKESNDNYMVFFPPTNHQPQ